MKEQKFAINSALNTSRHEFDKASLTEDQCDKDPFVQFERWLSEAIDKDPLYANAMTLCTMSQSGMPDARTVLLRNVSYGGLTFYTNYASAKGRQIAANSQGCVLFFWKELERQVKVQGEIKFLPEKVSDDYFKTRPLESKIGAWASRQSQIVKDRGTLDERFNEMLIRYKDQDVPRPSAWGGYVLLPSSFEFWQGRTGRLHDRLRYTSQGRDKDWRIERLMP